MSVVRVTQDGPSVRVVTRNTPVEIVNRPTIVKAGSAQGQQGIQGVPGGSIPGIAFSYGDAAGIIWTPDSAGMLVGVRIIMDTVFDTPATMQLGTLADPAAVMPADMTDLQQLAEYENTPDLRMVAGAGIRIAINPAGATQGHGLILLTFNPD